MDMNCVKPSNQNRYALTIIYINICIYIYIYLFSKYGDVQPMNNQDSNSVYEALLNKFSDNEIPNGYVFRW